MRRDIPMAAMAAFAAIAGSVSVPAQAQTTPEPTVVLRNAAPGLVTVTAANQPLDAVLKQAAAQSKTTIYVEPGINQAANATINRLPFETALTQLVGENGPYWAKVEIVQKRNAEVPQQALFNLVRAFHALPSDRMAVGLAGGAGTVTLSRGGAATPAPVLAEDQQRVIAYVVANRTVAVPAAGRTGDEVVDRFSQTNQQRQELMQQMSPEQRAKAVQQELMYLMQLPREARQQMVEDRRNAWRSMPDEMRQQLRDTMRDTFQGMGGGRRGGGRGNRGGNGTPRPQ